MRELGSWLRAILHEWITLLSGGGITACVGLWERYSQKPVPAAVYTAIIALFVLLANFRAFRNVESQLTEERRKSQTFPNIRVDRYYVDIRYFGADGQFTTPLSCLHVRFKNDPVYPAEAAIGRAVIAELAYSDAAEQPLFQFNGRWGDTDQPIKPGQPIVQLDPADFQIGAQRELDLAFKYLPDPECYAINNETYRVPDWRDPTRVLCGEEFSVRVRLRAARVDRSWVFRFRNLGPGNGLEVVRHEALSADKERLSATRGITTKR